MQKILFLIVFISLFVLKLMAHQNDFFEDIKGTVSSYDEINKAKILNKLSFLEREKNLTKAFEYANEAEKIGIELKDSLILANAMENLGWIYYKTGVWDKAFRYSRDAYILSYKIRDKKGLAMSLNNLGVIYYKQKNYTEAIKKFKEAYSIGVQLDDPFLMVRSLNNTALNFLATVQLDSAYHYAYQALTINNEFQTNFYNSFIYRVIGDIQLVRSQIDDAIDTYKFALHTASHNHLESFEASILHRLGNAYMLKGEIETAIELLEKGKDMALEKNYQEELIQCYKFLAIAYEKVDKLDLAFYNQMAFNRLGDILEDRVNKDRLALIAAMFEVEKSDAEIRYLRAENDYQDLQIKSFKTYNILFTFGTIFLAGLFVWLWSLHKKTIAMNKELLDNQMKVEQQKEELQKQSQNLDRSNRLKNRLFSILAHDLKTPVAQLQGVLGLFNDDNMSQKEFLELSPTLKRNVDGLYVTLDNILTWSRAQMEGFKVQLRPTLVKPILFECLSLLEQYAIGKGIAFKVEVEEDLRVWVDIDLFQIILRNLIGNAVKYSKRDSQILIEARENGDQAFFSIIDKGVGISAEKLAQIKQQQFSLIDSSNGTENEKGTGLGINLCKEFTKMMDGEIAFESKRNEGTKVFLKFKRVKILSNSQGLLRQNQRA
ncbi:MAG: tetratricopeptide repeat-containing sensor histidine kinase [Cecembia sp.]